VVVEAIMKYMIMATDIVYGVSDGYGINKILMERNND
jgi:hypothetical protein